MVAFLFVVLFLLAACAFIPSYEDRQRLKWMMKLQDDWEVHKNISIMEEAQARGKLTEDEVRDLEQYKDLHRTPWGYRARREQK